MDRFTLEWHWKDIQDAYEEEQLTQEECCLVLDLMNGTLDLNNSINEQIDYYISEIIEQREMS